LAIASRNSHVHLQLDGAHLWCPYICSGRRGCRSWRVRCGIRQFDACASRWDCNHPRFPYGACCRPCSVILSIALFVYLYLNHFSGTHHQIATSLTGLVFGCLNWCGLARRKPRKKTLDELGEDDDGGFMGVGKKKKRIVRRTLDDDDDFQEPPLPRVYVDEPPEEPPKRPWWAFLVPSRKKDTQQGEDTDKPAKAAVSVKKPAPPGPPPSIAGTQKEGKGPFWPFGKASSALPPAPVALRQVPEKVVNYPPPPPELATMTTVEDAQPVWVWWTPPQASTKSVVVPLEMPSPPINATSASSIPLESGYLSQAGSAGLPPSNAAARAVRPPPPSESPAAKKKREKEEAAAEMDRSNFARQRMAYGAAPAEIEMDLVQPGGPVPHPADHDRIEVVVIDPGSVTADMATGKGKGKGKGAMNRPDSIAITEDHDTRKKKQFKDLEAQSEEGEGGPRSGSFLFRLTHGNNQPQRAQPNNIFHAKPDLTT